ncbi:lipoprotein, partial [Salmonella enterica subsp. enterica serovar Heidelberg str. SARA37]
LWDENGAEEPWLTAYAMDFLIRAGEQGYRT